MQTEFHTLVRGIKWDSLGADKVDLWLTKIILNFTQCLSTDYHHRWDIEITKLRDLLTGPEVYDRYPRRPLRRSFNLAIVKQRRALRRAAHLHKLNATVLTAKNMVSLRKAYKKTTWEAKKQKEQMEWLKIHGLLKEKNLTHFWNYINKLRSSNKSRGMRSLKKPGHGTSPNNTAVKAQTSLRPKIESLMMICRRISVG